MDTRDQDSGTRVLRADRKLRERHVSATDAREIANAIAGTSEETADLFSTGTAPTVRLVSGTAEPAT